MAQQGSQAGAKQEGPRFSGLKRKLILAAIGLAVLLGLLVLLGPTLLSTGPGKRYILGKVNEGLEGKLTVEGLSLGWFSGIRITGAEFSDAEGYQTIRFRSLTSNASLMRLIRGDMNLGEVNVEDPVVSITVPPTKPPKPPKARKPLSPSTQRTLSTLRGSFHVHRGEVSVSGLPSVPKLHLTNVEASADIVSLSEAVSNSLSMEVEGAGGKGTLSLTGTVSNLDGMLMRDEIPGASYRLEAKGVDLAPFASVAEAYGVDLRWTGTLDSTMDINFGAGQLALKGRADLDGITLFGGPFGRDRVTLGKVGIPVDLTAGTDGIDLRQLRVENELLNVSVQGTARVGKHGWLRLDEYSELQLAGKFNVEAARIAAMLPDTLKLKEGLKLLDGTIEGEIDGTSMPMQVAGRITLKGLRAELDGNPVAMTEDLTINGIVRSEDGHIVVPQVIFKSGFAGLLGSGTLDEFSLTGDADLAKLAAQLRSFVKLEGVDLGGTATVTLHAKGELGKLMDVHLQADVQDLNVTGLLQKPLTQRHASITARARVETLKGPDTWPKRVTLIQSSTDVPAAGFQLTTDNFSVAVSQASLLMQGWKRPDVESFDLVATADWAKGYHELVDVLGLPDGVSPSGNEVMSCTGSMKGDVLELTRFGSTTTNLVVKLGGTPPRQFAQESLQVSGSARWDMKKDLLEGADLVVSAVPFQAKVASFTFAGLTSAAPEVTAEGVSVTGTVDLGRFMHDYGPLMGITDQVALAGTANIECAGGLKDRTVHLDRVKAVGEKLNVVIKGYERSPITQKDLILEGTGGSWSWQAGVLKVGSLTATGDFGKATVAEGSISGLGTDKPAVSARSFDVNATEPLAMLTPYMGVPVGITLSGTPTVKCKGSVAGSVITVDDVQATCKDLFVRWAQDGTEIRQKALTVKGSGKLDWNTWDVESARMDVTGDFGKATATNLKVKDLGTGKPTVTGQVDSKAELAALQRSFGSLLGLDAKTACSGTQTLALSVQTTADNHIRAEGTGTIRDFRLKTATELPEINEPVVTLVYKLDYDVSRQRIDVTTAKVTSGILSVDAKGTVTDVGKTWTVTNVAGTMDYDGEKVRVLLSPWLPTDTAITGKRHEAFTVDGPLYGADWKEVLRKLKFKTGCGFDQFATSGIMIGKFDGVLTGNAGKITLSDISTTINNGKLTGSAFIDVRANEPQLKKGDTDIQIQKMEINELLTKQFLKYVNPIFGPGDAKGLITAKCSKLQVPLNENAMTNGAISARVQVDDLDMEVRGLLADILGAVGGQDIRVKGKVDPFDLTLADGRVSYNDMTVHVGKLTLAFRGSVGIKDESVALEVGLPLTGQLLSALPGPVKTQVETLLGGERVYLPITGTLSHPRLAIEKLLDEVQRLLGNALKRGLRLPF